MNPFVYYEGTQAHNKVQGPLETERLRRLEVFIQSIEEHRIRHTPAFIGNLLEKNG